MAAANELLLKLKAENKGLKAKIEESEKRIGSLEKKANKGNKGMAKGFSNVKRKVLGFGLAITGLVYGIKKLMSAYAKQEDAENRVAATLKATGHAAGLTQIELENMAKGLQQVTKFGDEVILEGQALLLTFTKIGKETFPRATEAVLDMSTAFGQDMKQSAIQLGTALNDPIKGVGRLRRIGVSFNAEQERMIKNFVATNDIAGAQKVILDELGNEFGGIAREQATTFAGKMVQIKNRLADFAETVGSDFRPAVEELVGAFENTDSVIFKVARTLGRIISSFVLFASIAIKSLNNIPVTIEYSFAQMKWVVATSLADIMKQAEAMFSVLQFFTPISKEQFGESKKIIEDYAKNAEDNFTKVSREYMNAGREDAATMHRLKEIWSDGKKESDDYTGKIIKNTGNRINATNQEIASKRQLEELKAQIQFAEYVGETETAELLQEQEKYNQLLAMQNKFNLDSEKLEKAFEKRREIAAAKGRKKRMDLEVAYSQAKMGLMSAEWQAFKEMSMYGATLMQSSNKTLFRLGKALALAQIAMNTAQAVTKVWAQWGFPLGGIYSGIIIAAGAIQADKVKNQEMPSYEKGRIPSFQNGTVPKNHFPALVGSDEAIINARSTKNNIDLLRAINASPNGAPVATGGTVINNYDFRESSFLDQDAGDKIVDLLEERARFEGTTLFRQQGE
jgi:hypothetical protein